MYFRGNFDLFNDFSKRSPVLSAAFTIPDPGAPPQPIELARDAQSSAEVPRGSRSKLGEGMATGEPRL